MRPVLLTLAVALAARTLTAQGAEGTVSGTVRDEAGRPVQQALVVLDVEVNARRTRTDAEGRFRFVRVGGGTHQLEVVRLGLAPFRSRIEVTPDGVELAIEMRRIPIQLDTVSVRVTRTGLYGLVATRGMELLPHDPRPLARAVVEILDTPHRVTTGADGRFAVESLAEGSYAVLVRLDRYASRMVSVYVPPDGGVDVTIVLDSAVAEYQRRDDNNLREISRRLREATNPSALVGLHELAAPEGTTLKDALRLAPSALSRGLLVKDDVTCIYVNGEPRPGMVASDILASDVQAVELYGIFANGSTMAPPSPWVPGTFCGTGMKQGPNHRPDRIPGRRAPPMEMDNFVRTLVVWLKR